MSVMGRIVKVCQFCASNCGAVLLAVLQLQAVYPWDVLVLLMQCAQMSDQNIDPVNKSGRIVFHISEYICT